MTTRIKIRRDSSTNWETVNPILALGELGLDTTSNQLKAGDGTSHWNDLSYMTGVNIFNQSLNTSDDVTFNILSIGDIRSTGMNVYTNANSGGDIDLFTDWGNGGVEVWLQHNNAVSITTHDANNQWAFDKNGKLNFPQNIGVDLNWTSDTADSGGGTHYDSLRINNDHLHGLYITNTMSGTASSWLFGKDGILTLPSGGDIKRNGSSVLGGGTRWDAVPAVQGCPIYAELTPDHFQAYTQNSHLDLENTGDWNMGSHANGTGVDGTGSDSELYSNSGNVSIRTNGSQNYWTFGNDGVSYMPNDVKQKTSSGIQCPINVDTVIYTGTNSGQHTFKLLLQAEGFEATDLHGWDTQSCEMMVAKSFRNDSVAGSAYGLVYTSNSPLATFSARWNSSTSTVEVLCRPTSTTYPVYVRSFVTELFTSD